MRTLDEMTVMADGLVACARGQRGRRGAVEVRPFGPARAALRRARRRLRASGAAVTVRGRPVALARAFGNLVDNALRYGKAARVALARRLRARSVTVEDDGPGIAPERIETVFEPFVRGEASRSLATGGAGLGLSIARSIVRAHGGEVALENREGGGLTARVVLPAVPG